MKSPKSIRSKLFFWYATSLVSVTAFFYLAVHIFALPWGNLIFLLLLLALALEGLIIIRKMTDGLTALSTKVKSITSKNLSEKVTDIDSDDEIGELAHSFNQLLTRLDGAFTRERQFIGDIAHELKTPLSSQRASLELALSKDRKKEEYIEALAQALADSNRISGTLTNVLDLAWTQAEGAQKGEVIVDLSGVVEETKEIATQLSFEKHITVEGSIAPKIRVWGRSDKLLRAFLNIVDNAVKFTPTRGTITIDLYTKEETVVFRVKDTGIGISQKELPHIFERFYRGSETDKTFGSGLGLAIAKAIVVAHRGQIQAKSRVGKGSEFTVFLPLSSS
ncbi:MAG: HAMP domain-containing sensor histidine kinase [Patescibacteria group bacterium]